MSVGRGKEDGPSPQRFARRDFPQYARFPLVFVRLSVYFTRPRQSEHDRGRCWKGQVAKTRHPLCCYSVLPLTGTEIVPLPLLNDKR